MTIMRTGPKVLFPGRQRQDRAVSIDTPAPDEERRGFPYRNPITSLRNDRMAEKWKRVVLPLDENDAYKEYNPGCRNGRHSAHSTKERTWRKIWTENIRTNTSMNTATIISISTHMSMTASFMNIRTSMSTTTATATDTSMNTITARGMIMAMLIPQAIWRPTTTTTPDTTRKNTTTNTDCRSRQHHNPDRSSTPDAADSAAGVEETMRLPTRHPDDAWCRRRQQFLLHDSGNQP